jgi:hypothetical protein
MARLQTLQYLNVLSGHGVGFRSLTEQYLDSCGMFKDAIISILATLSKSSVFGKCDNGRSNAADPDALFRLMAVQILGNCYRYVSLSCRSRDTRLDRTVAIKKSGQPFSEREAQAIAALNHPHICYLYNRRIWS